MPHTTHTRGSSGHGVLRAFGLALVIVLAHVGAGAQPQLPSLQFQASMAVAAALNSRDVAKAMEVFADNAVLFAPGRELIAGRKDIQKVVQDLLPVDTFKLSLVSIGSTGTENFGYDAGLYRVVTTPKEGAPRRRAGKYLAVLNRDGEGRWRITHLSWSGSETDSAGK